MDRKTDEDDGNSSAEDVPREAIDAKNKMKVPSRAAASKKRPRIPAKFRTRKPKVRGCGDKDWVVYCPECAFTVFESHWNIPLYLSFTVGYAKEAS